MAEHRHIRIIILTWNGLNYTNQCLASLRANTSNASYSVMVVDNGSTDGTVEYLQKMDWIHTVFNDKNLGFVRGNNVALKNLPDNCDIVLLNNDTEIYQPNWLDELQKTAHANPETGIVGCRLARKDGKLLHAGAYMPPTYWGQQIGSNQVDVGQFGDNREVESIVFACAYIKRELFDAIGLLDEDFFSYFEDSDYCLRAKNAGFKTVCCGSVTLVHHENVTTEVNQIKHSDLFEKSQKIFRHKWERQIETSRYEHELDWHSIVNFPTGYAISSKEMMLALDKAKVNLRYKYVYGRGTPFPVEEPEMSDSYMINVIRQREFGKSKIQVVYGQGDVFRFNSGKYRIGFTMLETDHIPEDWAAAANEMDEVWVPSSFNVKTFRDSGVTRPIHVIPLGIDPDYFNPQIKSYRISDAFTFLSIFEWGERKSPELLLKAFNDEFRSNEDVVLICKTSNNDGSISVSKQIKNLNLSPEGGRIVFSLNEVVPSYQLGSLYRSADCFVLPTHGEGWGMPMLEAMACGLPVIATNWSSHCDFMNSDNSYLLDYEGLVSADAKCPYYLGFNWAKPSYEHLRKLMRYAYEHQEDAKNKGRKAAADAHEKWTWENTAKKIMQRIKEVKA